LLLVFIDFFLLFDFGFGSVVFFLSSILKPFFSDDLFDLFCISISFLQVIVSLEIASTGGHDCPPVLVGVGECCPAAASSSLLDLGFGSIAGKFQSSRGMCTSLWFYCVC
jgi:hypothetical protein